MATVVDKANPNFGVDPHIPNPELDEDSTYTGDNTFSGTSVFSGGTTFSGTVTATGTIIADGDIKSTDDVITIRNGVNGQTLQVYNTYTSDSVYERAYLKWLSSVFTVGTEHTGANLRSMRLIGNTILFNAAGADKLTLGSTSLFPTTDAGVNLGSAANRFKDGFFSEYVRITPVAVASLVAAATAGAGAMAIVNNALTPALGNTVAGGGAVYATVVSDGTNWKVV